MSNSTKNKRETWCGYRPSIIPAKKKNKKHERKESKQICRDAIKENCAKAQFHFYFKLK